MSPTLRKHLIGCESSFIAIKQKSLGKVAYRVFPTKCNSWDCPDCAKIKAKKYRERMRGLFDGRPLWMYTFTYYHNKPAIEVWREYSLAWNRFRTAAAKRFGGFSYARILEHHHKSPYPHLHVIADKDFGACWMATELKSSGFGYQARCKTISTEGAITYVTKYLTKVWTDEACKSIRRALSLRIVSFGGSACSRISAGDSWNIVTRDRDCDQCCDKCAIDVSWTHGQDAKLISERVVDAFIESVFILEDELLILEAKNEELPEQ